VKPQVNALEGRLRRRPPQRRSMEMLDRITEIVPPSLAQLRCCEAQEKAG